MIEDKELRIGNWVKESDGRLVRIHDGFGIDHHRQFETIPLTPAILEQCGFELVKSHLAFQFATIAISGGNRMFWKAHKVVFNNSNPAENFDLDLNLPEIKYLHQLQNLYFALTGEELTVNALPYA